MTCAKLTKRFAIPPLFIILPDITNNGTANKEKLLIPVTIFCVIVYNAVSNGITVRAVTMDAIPILTEIGTPIIRSIANVKIKTNMVVFSVPPPPIHLDHVYLQKY